MTLRAGVGLKAEHLQTILQTRPSVGFFEIHAENYLSAGGPPHRYLTAIREHYALSIHGVGLSIGAAQPLDTEHLARLEMLLSRYEPALFSEHLAWSTHGSAFLNDLLPVPYTDEALRRVTDHIDQIQERLSRPLLLENPARYLAFEESSYLETQFLTELVRRCGCALLLDINNVCVSATNLGYDPFDYINSLPAGCVRQIHLAGHECRRADLLIDTHDRAVAEPVWRLYAHALRVMGPLPTLIEWDANIPGWATLQLEAQRANVLMQEAGRAALA
jgi:uncharacterized protein